MIKYDPFLPYMSAAGAYPDLDGENAVEALRGAVRCNTVSYTDKSRMDAGGFVKLHELLRRHFPLVHSTMEWETVSDWSLLYRWKGSNSALKPVLFMGHQDTVPVAPGTEGGWRHPPFGGDLAEGFVWGRGAIDDKSMVVGQLAAAEYLIGQGFKPKRDLYLAFGQDEESMGYQGAKVIAEMLESRGVRLEFVLDEGGGFAPGDAYGAPGLYIAKVDVCEKGYADVSIQAQADGGHSSRPGKSTALGRVARAIVALEENQFEPRLGQVAEAFFTAIAPAITQEPLKSYVADLSQNREALARYLSENPSLAPLVHTTTAATMISASPAPNVLPQSVQAVCNFRLAPWDSCAGVVEHCRRSAADPGLDIQLVKGMEPSKVSKTASWGMDMIRSATGKFYKGFQVVPGMVFGGTDCRYFEALSDCCYRFRPFIDNMLLYTTVHGTDERSSVQSFVYGIKFFVELMQNACG